MLDKEGPKTKDHSPMLSAKDAKGKTYCLKLENVSKFFGGLQAVRSVSMEVGIGERRAIIGPNGAGKTTLFNLIAGNHSISSGKVLFRGEDISRLPCHRRASKGIARTYQITNLFPNLTVTENVRRFAVTSRCGQSSPDVAGISPGPLRPRAHVRAKPSARRRAPGV